MNSLNCIRYIWHVNTRENNVKNPSPYTFPVNNTRTIILMNLYICNTSHIRLFTKTIAVDSWRELQFNLSRIIFVSK